MTKLSNRVTGPVLLALAAATLGSAVPSTAQPVQNDWRAGQAWNRDAFWRGAPTDLRQRIDWLQQRIQRGLADGSLDRREARQAQYDLDSIKRQADALDQRLDDVSRRIRWSRGGYGGGAYNGGGYQGGRDPYTTDYDAYRDYRPEPNYVERRLGPNDPIYRGSDGRYYCKRNDGTTGLVVGAIGGAAIGNVIDGGHDRLAGTLIGGALGALIGKSVDQNSSDVRCR
jgi:hypothetical protein